MVMSEMQPERERRDPWFEGMLGFAWMFAAGLLVFGSGAVMAIAVGTHLIIRLRPDTSRVVTFDPSTIGSIAFIPVLVGVMLAWLFRRRLGRRGRLTR